LAKTQRYNKIKASLTLLFIRTTTNPSLATKRVSEVYPTYA
jgi:hypothetical protein